MDAYQVQRLDEAPILVVSLYAAFRAADHREAALAELAAALDSLPGPGVLILELSEFQFSFDDLLQGANRNTSAQGLMRHPHIAQTIVVTTNAVLRLATQGMNTVTFGNLDVRATDSLDEAITLAREYVQAGAG